MGHQVSEGTHTAGIQGLNGIGDPDPDVRLELDAIMPSIASAIIERVGADCCSIYIYDQDRMSTIASYQHGHEVIMAPKLVDADSWSPRDVPVEAELIRTGTTIQRASKADFDRFPMQNEDARWRAAPYVDIVVPFIWHAEVRGCAYIWRIGHASPFTDDEISTAEDIASVAAMAVQSAREVVRERARQHELNALLSVASLSSSHLTVDRAMPSITRIIRNLTGADVCNLYVYDTSGEYVLNGYSDGLNQRERWVFDQSDRFPVSEVPAEDRARKTHSPQLVTDPEVDLATDSELVRYALEANLSEILVVPINYQGDTIGVIYSWYRNSHRIFSRETTDAILGIANQAGGVISQARLYDESQQHIAETEALRRIGQAVLDSDSLDAVMDEIADSLANLIPYEYAFVATLADDLSTVEIKRHWGCFSTDLTGYQLPLHKSLTGKAILEGRIVNNDDAIASPIVHVLEPDGRPVRSVLIAPLTTDEGTIGALYIGRSDSEAFTLRQERVMSLLANQAAAAISRTQAREAIALRSRQQSFLAELADHLVSSDALEDSLQSIVEAGVGILADGVAIACSTWEYGCIRWEAASHVDPGKAIELRDGLSGVDLSEYLDDVERVLVSETVTRGHIDRDHATGGETDDDQIIVLLKRLAVSEVLVVPMRREGRAPGLLVLFRNGSGNSADRSTVEFAQLVANRIGDALERRQMAINRESLLRVSRSITGHHDMDEILETFVRELHRIVPYQTMYLGRLNDDRGSFRLLKYHNSFGIDASEINVASTQGVSGETIQTRAPVFDNEADARPTTVYADDSEASYYRRHGESAMAAPLVADDQVIGVLFISRFGRHRFSEADFETFLLFASFAASAIHRTELVESNQLVYRASVEVLAAVVDAKDPTTLEHSRRVAHYARLIAESVGTSDAETGRIELAGLLHDIGKLGIPDHVLSKPGPLSGEERVLMNSHSERGARILAQHPALADLVPLVRHHHERFDGCGYPDGLSGDEIPLGAYIIAVAEAFETMISQRTYQQSSTVTEAIGELEANAGSQFHPEIVETFCEVVRQNSDFEYTPPSVAESRSLVSGSYAYYPAARVDVVEG